MEARDKDRATDENQMNDTTSINYTTIEGSPSTSTDKIQQTNTNKEMAKDNQNNISSKQMPKGQGNGVQTMLGAKGIRNKTNAGNAAETETDKKQAIRKDVRPEPGAHDRTKDPNWLHTAKYDSGSSESDNESQIGSVISTVASELSLDIRGFFTEKGEHPTPMRDDSPPALRRVYRNPVRNHVFMEKHLDEIGLS